MNPLEPLRVLGVRVDPWRPDAIRARIAELVAGDEPLRTIYSVNPEGVMLAQRDDSFAAALERGDVCLSDGVGVTIAAWLRGRAAPRVPGVDLMIDAVGACTTAGKPALLLGAGPGVAAAAAERLRSRFPAAEIETYAPPISETHRLPPDVEAEIEKHVATLRPALVCVALGMPKQERWIDYNRAALDEAGVRVAMSVGGSFDFIAGTAKRAPVWLRRAGLEWAWRLAQEPHLRIHRQRTALPAFVRGALTEVARRRHGAG